MTVDAVVSGQEARLPSELIGTNKGPQALEAYSKAFNQGIISVGRLMEVVVFPFLKLAKAMNQETRSPAASKSTLEVTKTLDDSWRPINRDIVDFRGTESGPPLLQPAKRTELVGAMFDANIPEVFFQLLPNINPFQMFSYCMSAVCSVIKFW